MATQFIDAQWLGTGGELELLDAPYIYANFAGIGDWSAGLDAPYVYASFAGAGALTALANENEVIFGSWAGAGGWSAQLYEFNTANIDYAAEDGTTLYVAEDGSTQLITEWASQGAFYVAENGTDQYVIEGNLEDYTTEDGLTNYTAEDGVTPYYELGGGGLIWDYVTEDWEPLTGFATAHWVGVGGFNMLVTGTQQTIQATWSGVGGFSCNIRSIINLANANWIGAGGMAINIEILPIINLINANWNGVGSLSAWLQGHPEYSFIDANWSGVGGLAVDMVEVPNAQQLAYANWNGAGDWNVNVFSSHAQTINANWSGAGSFSIDVFSPTTYQINANWVGAGGWTANTFAPFINLINAQWLGTGGWKINVTRHRAPQELPANFLLCDPVWRRLYHDTMHVGEPTSLVLNYGGPLQNPILAIARPDATVYQGDPDLVIVGQQDFPAEVFFGPMPYPSFRAGQYIVYGFGAGELNLAGTWAVTLITDAGSVTQSFTVNPLGTYTVLQPSEAPLLVNSINPLLLEVVEEILEDDR